MTAAATDVTGETRCTLSDGKPLGSTRSTASAARGARLPRMAVTRRCSICDDGRAQAVNSMIATGKSDGAIERAMKDMDRPTKSETVKRHRLGCLSPDRGMAHKMALATLDTKNAPTDFAAAVRQEAIRLLNEGELRIRTADGLKAQEILDRREEKKADRDLMLNIARLMSGASMATPAELIEGEYSEVRELRDGLAPADLIAS